MNTLKLDNDKNMFEQSKLNYYNLAYIISTTLSYFGKIFLVGSNAYNIIENIDMCGDLDFVIDNRELIMNMSHKKRQGISEIIYITTFCIHGIMIDISTFDGRNLEEDMKNRSCITSAIKFSFDRKYKIMYHNKKQQIIPEFVIAQDWIQYMIKMKGQRIIKFWQKKLSKGFVWGNDFNKIILSLK